MNFQESISVCFSKYATFSGRAGRPEFWWFFLFQLLVGIATQALLPTPLPDLVSLLLLCPSLAVGARRLHDIGRTGWWQLLLLTGIGLLVLIFFWVQPSKDEGTSLYTIR